KLRPIPVLRGARPYICGSWRILSQKLSYLLSLVPRPIYRLPPQRQIFLHHVADLKREDRMSPIFPPEKNVCFVGRCSCSMYKHIAICRSCQVSLIFSSFYCWFIQYICLCLLCFTNLPWGG